MFDQCLIILFIFGSHDAVVAGQGQYYQDTTTTTTTSLPTSTSMTTSARPTTTERIVEEYDYGDLFCGFNEDSFCSWKNDPRANHSWLLNPFYDYYALMMEDEPAGARADPFIYFDEPSPRGNSSVRSVGIRIYQKPDYIALEDLVAYSEEAKKKFILFEVWGDCDDYWHDKVSMLKHFDSNFKIIVEGNFGEDPMYIAIGHVSVLQSRSCIALIPRSISSTSTTTSTTMSPTTTTTTTMSTTTTQVPLGIGLNEWDVLRCNFNNVDFCGWKNDPAADDRWFLSTNSKNFEKFSSGEGSEWYLYFNKKSSSGNGTVRLISPLYSRELEGSCFHFSYRIHTASHSRNTGIRIYIKPEYLALGDLLAYSDGAKKEFILFDIWGDDVWGYESEERYWSWNETKLMNVDYNFQIIIEGIYGQDNVYMALDDLTISRYPKCTPSVAPTIRSTTTTSPRPTTATFPRPTTTTSPRPTTRKLISPPTKERPQGVTGSDSGNILSMSIIAILGTVMLLLVFILAALLARQRGTYRLNALRANIVDTSSHDVKNGPKPPDVRYSIKDGDEVVIHCDESNQQNGHNREIDENEKCK
ncbi:uncharacterized protein [Maniola hyperantus]|uniref:uncharacterized protein n=1 Tax=Aphantopus hyperantus TaxID=2795564 RepID=UPI0037486840